MDSLVDPKDVIKWTEDDLLRQVVELAHATHWMVHHCRVARKKDGSWATPISGDAGFPDLVLLHPGNATKRPRVIFAELKGPKGKLTVGQHAWLYPLMQRGLIEAYVWTPDDWEEIVEVLSQ